MKGFGKFLSDKFDKFQQNVSNSVEKLNDKFATDIVNITAKVNEKVNEFQIKQASEKKNGPEIPYDVCMERYKAMKGMAYWFLAVSQEPSLGLFYVQNHFKESLDRTLACRKELNDFEKRLSALQMDVARTTKEVEGISQLNNVWASDMSILLDQLSKTYEKK